VIGGGVMGASVAYHLAARGWREVVILDRGAGPGEGSTGRATGGFRAQYATAINVRLSLLARDKLCRFAAETGVDPGYAPCGYLWIGADEREMAELRRGQRVQHAEGLHEAVELAPDDVLRLNPALAADGIAGGVFCPTDGFIRPLRVLEGYLAAGARLGVRVEWGTAATGFSLHPDGRISAVTTSRGPIGVEAVVNAAGPWAAAVAAWAGVTLPVTPLRRQAAATTPCNLLPERMPMTIYAGDGFHLRVRDGHPASKGGPSTTRWILAGSARWSPPPIAACPCSARPPLTRRRAGPASTRCPPTSTPFWAPPPAAPTSS
jgi:sarcosine oxidase subunit beta